MSTILSNNRNPLKTSNWSQGYFQWGKVCKADDMYFRMSYPVTCKDYLVDFYFRNSSYINPTIWTKKEMQQNCWYVDMTNREAKQFEKNIILLNAYEQKHRLKRTTIELATCEGFVTNGKMYIVTGSQVWMKSLTALSFYLSLIRICAYTDAFDVTTLIPVMNEKDPGYNEGDYFQSMTKTSQQIYDWCYRHPRVLFKQHPKKEDIVLGFITLQTGSHGMMGLFHMLSVLTHRAYAPSHPVFRENLVYQSLEKKYDETH